MNHGGAESTRDNEHGLVSRRVGASDFARAVAKVAVAQICENVGFQGFKESALDAFTEVAIRFLCDLGKNARFSANLAGRTECSVFDIIRGLEDLRTSEGFSVSDASEVKDCLASSGTVRKIIQYVSLAEEIPYAQPVTQFPVMRNRRMIPSFMQIGETPPGKHIPAWLPAFPDPHTYIHTAMWNERETDPRTDKIEQARQRRKAERSLLSLQQRLASSGSVGTSTLALQGDKVKDSKTAGHSVDSPLQLGEEDVSVVELPSKISDETAGEDHVSVLEAFAPAIEAVKSGFCDDGDVGRKFLSDKRPAVCFKLKTGKKLVGESLDLKLKNKGGRPVTWIARDDEKDDKKRRAEYILRQSMENPHDLMQL